MAINTIKRIANLEADLAALKALLAAKEIDAFGIINEVNDRLDGIEKALADAEIPIER